MWCASLVDGLAEFCSLAPPLYYYHYATLHSSPLNSIPISEWDYRALTQVRAALGAHDLGARHERDRGVGDLDDVLGIDRLCSSSVVLCCVGECCVGGPVVGVCCGAVFGVR